jgi:hypothetical protein
VPPSFSLDIFFLNTPDNRNLYPERNVTFMHLRFLICGLWKSIHMAKLMSVDTNINQRGCLHSLFGLLLLVHKNTCMFMKGTHNTMVHMGITLLLAEKLDKLVDLANALLCKWRSFHHSFHNTLPFLRKWNKTPLLQKRFTLFWGTITTETTNCPNTMISKISKLFSVINLQRHWKIRFALVLWHVLHPLA